MKPLVGITMGDINGVGPEIIVKAYAHHPLHKTCTPIVFGSVHVLEEATRHATDCPPVRPIEDLSQTETDQHLIYVMEGATPVPPYRPGQLDPQAARCAMEWFEEAVRLTQAGILHAVVTCPINKQGIHLAGYDSNGHTDHLAKLLGIKQFWMCLFAEHLRVLHLTAHMSLRDAIEFVQKDLIVQAIRAAHEALTDLGTPLRRIAVAGLNPHAGEGGAFGREEIEEIIPAIRLCREEGIECSGPYPADTLFGRMRDGAFDLVVALYHDQGHIPIKLVAMDTGVNVTWGLPIVRTSVDHGTAYDIAGTGKARELSLVHAVEMAARLLEKKATADK